MQDNKIYKVAVIDGSLVTRLGLEILIKGLADFKVTFSTSKVKDLMPLLWIQDLVIYTFAEYDDAVLEIITTIQSRDNAKPIIVYCPHLTTTEQLKLVGAGIKAIMSSALDENLLAKVLRSVAYGGMHFPPKIQNELKYVAHRPVRTSLVKAAFSELKLEILTLIAIGCTSHQIAALLNRSKHTIDWHKKEMRKMTRTSSTPELLLFSHDHGLIDSSPTQKGVKKRLNNKVGFSDTKLS